jgi:CheY-like chemotaxis protein
MPVAKVVVVEDDRDLQFLYKTKLEREGFDPHVVLLDLLMPNMGGAEMLAHLRARASGGAVRVIVLTNISKDEAPQALRFLRVDRYIVKAHHTPAQVVDIVHDVLGRSRHS